MVRKNRQGRVVRGVKMGKGGVEMLGGEAE